MTGHDLVTEATEDIGDPHSPLIETKDDLNCTPLGGDSLWWTQDWTKDNLKSSIDEAGDLNPHDDWGILPG